MAQRPDFGDREPYQPSLFHDDEEAFSPEECGWVRIGKPHLRYWEKPNGESYIFAPDVPELIYKFKGV